MPVRFESVSLPKKPGVYLFKTKQKRVLYVGKATKLNDRIRSYFSSNPDRAMIPDLIERADDIECIVHALKALVGKTGKQIFGEAIQIHGGMGITDELDIGHYAKRLMMINTTFGGEDHHQGKFNRLRYDRHSLA